MQKDYYYNILVIQLMKDDPGNSAYEILTIVVVHVHAYIADVAYKLQRLDQVVHVASISLFRLVCSQ